MVYMAQYNIQVDASVSVAVDSYLEYSRIVREDDKGKPFTSEEYEKYKKRVIPMRIKNRLFVSWTNDSDIDCKLIGPETLCFCGHRYHQHKTDFDKLPTERPVPQPCSSCSCNNYVYIPMIGNKLISCSCKHGPMNHQLTKPFKCKKTKCSCDGFSTQFVCGCGNSAATHRLITETRAERLARGHPVGHDTPYKAMGGVTGFSSLMDGYMRLDDSGLGSPSEHELNQPITASDHPFLRANVRSIKDYKLATGAVGAYDDELEGLSGTRHSGETDLDYYERRYQERLRGKRAAARGSTPAIKSSMRPSRMQAKGRASPSQVKGHDPGLSLSGLSISTMRTSDKTK